MSGELSYVGGHERGGHMLNAAPGSYKELTLKPAWKVCNHEKGMVSG